MHRTARRSLTVATVAVLATIAVVGSGSAASAAPARQVRQTKTETINAQQLLGAPHGVAAGTSDEKARANAYVRDQARQGRIVDSSLLRVATGTDPLTKGRVSTVWESGYQPREFRIEVF